MMPRSVSTIFHMAPKRAKKPLNKGRLTPGFDLADEEEEILAKHPDLTEEEIKELLCYKFLGTVDKQVGQTLIPAQVKSTRKLNQGEFYFFMNQVQDWALDLGIHLSHPEDSEYMKLQRSQ